MSRKVEFLIPEASILFIIVAVKLLKPRVYFFFPHKEWYPGMGSVITCVCRFLDYRVGTFVVVVVVAVKVGMVILW